MVPDAGELERIATRLAGGRIDYTREDGQLLLRDPWNNQVVLAVEPAAADQR